MQLSNCLCKSDNNKQWFKNKRQKMFQLAYETLSSLDFEPIKKSSRESLSVEHLFFFFFNTNKKDLK